MNKLKIRWTEFKGSSDAFIGHIHIGSVRLDAGLIGRWQSNNILTTNHLNPIITGMATMEDAKAMVELAAKDWFRAAGLAIEWEA